jgi:pyruvate dehydrogenase E2 component (dihydrolipoamide acetyltransferase)
LAAQKPFQSVIISGGDAPPANVPPTPAATEPTPDPVEAAPAEAAPAEAAPAEAAPAEEKPPIVRAPGINFGSANPRPTAANVSAEPPEEAEGAAQQTPTAEAAAE